MKMEHIKTPTIILLGLSIALCVLSIITGILFLMWPNFGKDNILFLFCLLMPAVIGVCSGNALMGIHRKLEELEDTINSK